MTEYYSALHWAKKSEKFANNSKSEAELAAQYAVASRPLGIKNITNCLTSIPQDIKLELKDGTLTIKAGSKFYVPNGFESDGTTPKFDEVIIDADRQLGFSDATHTGVAFMYLRQDNSNALWEWVNNAQSGSSWTPTAWNVWYDTENNFIKRYETDTSTSAYNISLPIAIFTRDKGSIISLDQVFNGFGFIGSTIFALPGVKGLIPNYRNPDGSLKNIEITLDKVKIQNRTDWGSALRYFWLGSDGKLLSTVASNVTYDAEENKNHNTYDNTNVGLICGEVTSVDGRITSIAPKTVFHAVNYDDVNSSVPTGTIFPFAGDKAPSGFYLCDGSEKSRITDAILFAVIGEKFGAGDGSTTFNLPLLTDNRFLEGSTTAGTQKNAGLPNITGTFGNTTMRNDSKAKFNTVTGAFAGVSSSKSTGYGTETTSQTGNYVVDFKASRSSSIYGNSSTVQPKSLTCLYIIKR